MKNIPKKIWKLFWKCLSLHPQFKTANVMENQTKVYVPDADARKSTPVHLKGNPMEFALHSISYCITAESVIITSVQLRFPKLEIKKLEGNGDKERIAYVMSAANDGYNMLNETAFRVVPSDISPECYERILKLTRKHEGKSISRELKNLAFDVPAVLGALKNAVYKIQEAKDSNNEYVILHNSGHATIHGYRYDPVLHCMVECEILAIRLNGNRLQVISRSVSSNCIPDPNIENNWEDLESDGDSSYDLVPTLNSICTHLYMYE